jgi:predicted O-methyltransferase YrrM
LKVLPRKFGHLTTDGQLSFLVSLVEKGYVPVFEFGTFTGRTTYTLAHNTNHNIYTIDKGFDAGSRDSAQYGDYVIGEAFMGEPEAQRITQLIGDSREVDLSCFYDAMGLVFVDGGHEYDIVKHDSEEAFKMVRPGGVIVWDDFNYAWPEVVEVIFELSRFYAIVSSPRLSMAVYEDRRA